MAELGFTRRALSEIRSEHVMIVRNDRFGAHLKRKPPRKRGMSRHRHVAGVLLMLWDVPTSAATVFATPEDPLKAFRSAVDSDGGQGLVDLFGKEHEADLTGGDPAEARQNVLTLRRMAAQSMTLMPDGEGRMTIVMGGRGWPMPVLLEQGPSGWVFDVKAGMQEITDRRVGRNELSAIALCGAYIDAQQRQYATIDHNNDGVLEFAQRLQSTEGKHDGLYWNPDRTELRAPSVQPRPRRNSI